MDPDPDAVAVLRRWEDAGGLWRVLARQGSGVTVGLFRCDGGEEIDRLVVDAPRLTEFLAGRSSSEESPPPADRDRDPEGRARQARPRDRLGRPLPYGSEGVEPVSEEPLPPLDTVAAARALLTEGRPFSAHEVYEARWKAAPTEERDLWQGLAQLCVAITHAERGNRTGALRLLGRAHGRLRAYLETGGPAYGLDLAAVVSWIAARQSDPDGRSWLTDQPL